MPTAYSWPSTTSCATAELSLPNHSDADPGPPDAEPGLPDSAVGCNSDPMARLFADTRPLRNGHFRRLWTANIVTVIGAQLTVVAVPAQIYADTGSSGFVGLAGLFGLVPLVVFGLYGGALADHFDKRRLLLTTTLGLIVSSGAFFVQAALGNTNVWLVLSIFAVQQGFFAVNQPTRTALLPQILGGAELLPAAASLNMTVAQAGAIAGPLVAGILIPFTGYPLLYLLDTLALTATLAAVWRLPSLPGMRASAAEADDRAMGGAGEGAGGRATRTTGEHQAAPGLRSVLVGLRYLAGHPIVLMSFVVDIIAMVFGLPRALFPELAHVSFAGPTSGGLAFALLFAAIPAGAVLGGVLSGWVSSVSRHGRATVLAIVVWGLAIGAFGAASGLAGGRPQPWLWPAVAALMVAGAADMVSAAFRQTTILTVATEDVRGRLQGVFLVVVAGGPRIADVLHGGAAEYAGAPAVTMAGGALVVLGVAVATLAAPAYWRFRASGGRSDGPSTVEGS